MSIRIQNDQLSGAAASQTSQTENVRSSQGGLSTNYGASTARSDSVQISSMTEGIAAAGAAQDAKSSARVAQLSALYSSGRYQVDSAQLSRKLVSGAIVGSGGGSE